MVYALRQSATQKDHLVTDAALRCKMVRLAIEGFPKFRLSEFEVQRAGNTYTAETLRLLHLHYPEHRFYFIVGADSLYEIENWFHPEQVMSQTILLAAGREYADAPRNMEEQIAYLKEKYKADIRMLHCREMDISSNELREMESHGHRISRYVPRSVENYIQIHKLYQD